MLHHFQSTCVCVCVQYSTYLSLIIFRDGSGITGMDAMDGRFSVCGHSATYTINSQDSHQFTRLPFIKSEYMEIYLS